MVFHLDRRYRSLTRDLELPDGSRRVYHYHVRKTGGTSLNGSFMTLGHEDPQAVERRIARSALHRTISGRYTFAAHHRRVLEEGAFFFGWSHLPSHRLRLPPETFTVTVLRDPVKRVLSHYNYLRAGDSPGTAFPAPASERRLAAGGLSGFIDELPRRDLLRQLFMFSRRYDVSEAVDRLLGCSAVLRTETFDADLAALGRRLALPLVSRHDRVSGSATAPTAAELDRLREELEPEYELLRRLAPAPRPEPVDGVGPDLAR